MTNTELCMLFYIPLVKTKVHKHAHTKKIQCIQDTKQLKENQLQPWHPIIGSLNELHSICSYVLYLQS